MGNIQFGKKRKMKEGESYERISIIMKNKWFGKVEDLYGESFPWQVRWVLSTWLDQNNSFMEWDPKKRVHSVQIAFFMYELTAELKRMSNGDLPNPKKKKKGQEDNIESFIYRETLSKLCKQVVAEIEKKPKKVFKQIKSSLNAEKKIVEELMGNYSRIGGDATSSPTLTQTGQKEEIQDWMENLWMEALHPHFFENRVIITDNVHSYFYYYPKEGKWSWIIKTINDRFSFELGRGLSDEQKAYLKELLFRKTDGKLDNDPKLKWEEFAVDACAQECSFGEWLFYCLQILNWTPKDDNSKKTSGGMRLLWTQGRIFGFMKKEKVEELLKKQSKLMRKKLTIKIDPYTNEKNTVKLPGVFAIRFPERKPGTIATYVYMDNDKYKGLACFNWCTISELNEKSFADRILNTSCLEYLYPDIKKKDVF